MFEKIKNEIQAAVAGANSNEAIALWKMPLVKFARAGHPDFLHLKASVSPTHLLPEDVLHGAKSVVCFFLPFEDFVAAGNRESGSAGEEWARAYIATNGLIAAIGCRVEELLAAEGFRAGKIPATHNFDESTLLSDWSHRHVARIAGLGEFGVNNMLITDAGTCGRLGSVVTDCDLGFGGGFTAGGEPERHPRRERCLFKLNGSCGLCLKRCEAGAYGRNPDGTISFDRARCYAVCLANAERHKNLGYADVCGKCLAGLPCSSRSPA